MSSKLSSVEIENHLEQGRKLLSSGQLSDALTHYHAAVGKLKFVRNFCCSKLPVVSVFPLNSVK